MAQQSITPIEQSMRQNPFSPIIYLLALLAFVGACTSSYAQVATDTSEYGYAKWQPVDILVYDTSQVWDQAGTLPGENPWRDVSIRVAFNKQWSPGQPINLNTYRSYARFVADGDAANTGATTGNVWKARFIPPETGFWTYTVYMGVGDSLNMEFDTSPNSQYWSGGYIIQGNFFVKDSLVDHPSDFDKHGPLHYTNARYPRYQDGTWLYPITAVESRENRLAYTGFGDTTISQDGINDHLFLDYAPHWQDTSIYPETIPAWDTTGGGLFGEASYLMSKSVSGISMVINNNAGQGKNVVPYLSHSTPVLWEHTAEQFNFDVVKLDRWEDYLDYLRQIGKGFVVEFDLWDDENSRNFSNKSRGIYLNTVGAATFQWYPGSIVNLGENMLWPFQQTEGVDTLYKYILWAWNMCPYGGQYPYIVTSGAWANQIGYDAVYSPLIGFTAFSGPSLTVNNPVNTSVIRDLHDSTITSNQWMISVDNNLPSNFATLRDGQVGYYGSNSYDQLDIIDHWMWGSHFMQAWKVSYTYDNIEDRQLEDHRVRENLFNLSANQADFWQSAGFPWYFATYGGDSLCGVEGHHVLAWEDSSFLYYHTGPSGQDFKIKVLLGEVYSMWTFDTYTGNWQNNGTFFAYNPDSAGFISISHSGQNPMVALITRLTCNTKYSLPVEFLGIDGDKTHKGNTVTVFVTNEVNVQSYTLYNYYGTEITTTDADGSYSYQLTDKNNHQNEVYYVVATDFDGGETYSNSVHITGGRGRNLMEIRGTYVEIPEGNDWFTVDSGGRKVILNENLSSGTYWIVTPTEIQGFTIR